MLLLYMYIFRLENVLCCFQVLLYSVMSGDERIKIGEVSCNMCVSLI